MASCSRSGHDTDLQAAIEASEYEFAYELQLREVLSLSDSELAFNLQVQEAINASSTNNPDYSASSSSSSDSRIGTFVSEERASPSTTNLKYSFPSFSDFDSGIGPSILEERLPLFNRDNPSLLTVNARRDQPSSSQVMFVHEEKQSLIFHRNGKEPAIEELNVATPEGFKPPLLDVSPAKSPCVICLEMVSEEECFHGLDCCHTLCIPCLVRYVQFSVFEGKQMRLHCADVRCGETASVEDCEKFLPSAMAEQWKNLVLDKNWLPSSVVCIALSRIAMRFLLEIMKEEMKGMREEIVLSAPCVIVCFVWIVWCRGMLSKVVLSIRGNLWMRELMKIPCLRVSQKTTNGGGVLCVSSSSN